MLETRSKLIKKIDYILKERFGGRKTTRGTSHKSAEELSKMSGDKVS